MNHTNKHIYIFNYINKASQYGIGTFINQLCMCLSENNITIITLNSQVNEITIQHNGKIRRIDIPAINYYDTKNNYIRYYRNLSYIVSIYANKKEANIFILNYYFMHPIIEYLKKHMNDCKIIAVVHFLGWCFPLNGNISKLRKIVTTKTKDEEENIIYEEFIQEKRYFNQVDYIICLSKQTEELLSSLYMIEKYKIVKIPNGIKDEYISLNKEERKMLKHKLLFRENDLIILYVGRLDPSKGLDLLISSFYNVTAKLDNAHLIIVGDGDYDTYIKKCFSIRNKITFTGKITKENLYQYYQIADVGVILSYHEQCSFVAIEMMMHKIPLIGSNNLGIKEMISKDLKLFHSEDINSLSQLIIKVLTSSNHHYQTESKEIYKRMYTFKEMKNKYIDFLESI